MGIQLWAITAYAAKSELSVWLRPTGPTEKSQPYPGGWCHFPEYPPAFFKQLTSEELITRIVKGRRTTHWELRPGRRNEVLDCRIYARAAAAFLALKRMPEEQWKELEYAAGIAQRSDTGETPKAAPAPPPEREPERPAYWSRSSWRTPKPT
jgi:phage terminase large subunit GpA-like protein